MVLLRMLLAHLEYCSLRLLLMKSPQAQESQQMCCSLQILELELESPEFIRFF